MLEEQGGRGVWIKQGGIRESEQTEEYGIVKIAICAVM